MIQTARRNLSVYSSILAMIPKQFMAYQLWFWIGLVLNVISMAILVYFWRAIYANTSTISGLAQNQTINYILLAFIFMPLTRTDLIWEFGGMSSIALVPKTARSRMYCSQRGTDQPSYEFVLGR